MNRQEQVKIEKKATLFLEGKVKRAVDAAAKDPTKYDWHLFGVNSQPGLFACKIIGKSNSIRSKIRTGLEKIVQEHSFLELDSSRFRTKEKVLLLKFRRDKKKESMDFLEK